MKEFVMFGFGSLLGDLLDIIHLNKGILAKVVLNIPEIVTPNRPSLQERLSHLSYPVAIESLDNFSPKPGQSFFFGFKGPQLIPLREYLKGTFSLSFANLIHPGAILSPTVRMGEGCVINAGAIIGSYTVLRNHVVVNRGATVGHDVVIEDYVFIGPGAAICGFVRVRERAFISVHATVIEDKEVGSSSRIGAGAVCITDTPPNALMVGVPAKVKEYVDKICIF